MEASNRKIEVDVIQNILAEMLVYNYSFHFIDNLLQILLNFNQNEKKIDSDQINITGIIQLCFEKICQTNITENQNDDNKEVFIKLENILQTNLNS